LTKISSTAKVRLIDLDHPRDGRVQLQQREAIGGFLSVRIWPLATWLMRLPDLATMPQPVRQAGIDAKNYHVAPIKQRAGGSSAHYQITDQMDQPSGPSLHRDL
jgi:hypothetical protein